MTLLARSILALVLCLTLGAGQALAFTGGDSVKTKKNPDYSQAVKLFDAGDYSAAVPLLRKSVAADPTNANAHNLLGFSHRKLGDVDTALTHYAKALELQPKHRGANEYLGELYLELGRLDEARKRLDVLDDACFFGCEEYRELKAKIEAYEAKAGG